MNPFKIFNLDSQATQEQLDQRYDEMRADLSEKRFAVGEEGERATQKLEEMKSAYIDACQQIRDRAYAKGSGDMYGFVEQLIKSGDIVQAQQRLDDITARDGEWHYLQSIIFYKQNWFLESKKQLEFAMAQEPSNAKYRDSYEKLIKVISNKTVNPEQLRTKEDSTQGRQVNQGVPTCTGNCCCDLCLANSCCNCMGGCM